jgi:hypothetical protein
MLTKTDEVITLVIQASRARLFDFASKIPSQFLHVQLAWGRIFP